MKLTIGSHFEGRTWTGDAAIEPHERDYTTLERVFVYFNRIDEHDARRLERIGYTLPSLSVGDLITLEDGRTFVVQNVGFSLVEDVSPVTRPTMLEPNDLSDSHNSKGSR